MTAPAETAHAIADDTLFGGALLNAHVVDRIESAINDAVSSALASVTAERNAAVEKLREASKAWIDMECQRDAAIARAERMTILLRRSLDAMAWVNRFSVGCAILPVDLLDAIVLLLSEKGPTNV